MYYFSFFGGNKIIFLNCDKNNNLFTRIYVIIRPRRIFRLSYNVCKYLYVVMELKLYIYIYIIQIPKCEFLISLVGGEIN